MILSGPILKTLRVVLELDRKTNEGDTWQTKQDVASVAKV